MIINTGLNVLLNEKDHGTAQTNKTENVKNDFGVFSARVKALPNHKQFNIRVPESVWQRIERARAQYSGLTATDVDSFIVNHGLDVIINKARPEKIRAAKIILTLDS